MEQGLDCMMGVVRSREIGDFSWHLVFVDLCVDGRCRGAKSHFFRAELVSAVDDKLSTSYGNP